MKVGVCAFHAVCVSVYPCSWSYIWLIQSTWILVWILRMHTSIIALLDATFSTWSVSCKGKQVICTSLKFMFSVRHSQYLDYNCCALLNDEFTIGFIAVLSLFIKQRRQLFRRGLYNDAFSIKIVTFLSWVLRRHFQIRDYILYLIGRLCSVWLILLDQSSGDSESD
jgi:hypothetical protein